MFCVCMFVCLSDRVALPRGGHVHHFLPKAPALLVFWDTSFFYKSPLILTVFWDMPFGLQSYGTVLLIINVFDNLSPQ